MAIEKWNPIGDLIAIQDRLNNLLKDALNTGSLANDMQSLGWSPPADFFETKETYVVVMEVPGLRGEEVDIKIEGNTLTISGSRQGEKAEKERNYFRRECSRDTFKRSFDLSAPVRAQDVTADLKQGVLEVFLPKSTQDHSQPLKVNVKTKGG
jgi:HSP20 family protein